MLDVEQIYLDPVLEPRELVDHVADSTHGAFGSINRYEPFQHGNLCENCSIKSNSYLILLIALGQINHTMRRFCALGKVFAQADNESSPERGRDPVQPVHIGINPFLYEGV